MRKANETTIFSKDELDGVTPDTNLPPAGAARNEELAKRTDILEQKAEELSENRGVIPEKFLDPETEREIQYDMSRGYMDIGADNPNFKTCWVNYVNLNGQKVWEKKAQGWKTATPDDFPEARHMSREDNTIRVGDVLLMFIRIDHYLRIQQGEDLKRRRQQFGHEQAIHDLAARNPGVFKSVNIGETSNMPDGLGQTIESRASATDYARKVAAKHIGNQMKTGTIPGIKNR